jgi:hypothetical protein
MPVLLYGCEIYANCAFIHLSRLCVLNNKLVRILTFMKQDAPVKEIYCMFNVPIITNLHKIRIMNIMHTHFYNKCLLPKIFANKYKLIGDTNLRSSRFCNNFFVSKMKTVSGQRISTYKFSILWNSLPCSIKEISTKNLFLKEVTKYFNSMSDLI